MSSHLAPGEYYGAVLARRSAPGAVLTELRHASPRRLPEHTHAAPFFCLLLDGAYVERVERRTLEYRPFTVGFHPAGLRHSDEIGRGGGRFFSIELPSAEPRGSAPEAEGSLPDRAELHGGRMSVLATRLYHAWKAGAADPMTVDELVLDLVAEAGGSVFPAERARPRWLQACFELLHAEYAQPLTIADVAGRVGVHPVHLSREFRRRYARTVGEYLNMVRVRHACEHLQRADRPLIELALETGFSDQSHLCRVFKRLIGCPPGRFRALHSSKTPPTSPS